MTTDTAVAMTVHEALNTLASLGTASEIAGYFAREGIKGEPKMTAGCPVARYLRQVTGVQVWVSPSTGDPEDAVVGHAEIEGWMLPKSVNDFALRFDEGDYRDLIIETS